MISWGKLVVKNKILFGTSNLLPNIRKSGDRNSMPFCHFGNKIDPGELRERRVLQRISLKSAMRKDGAGPV
jgi:hypothetical protein